MATIHAPVTQVPNSMGEFMAETAEILAFHDLCDAIAAHRAGDKDAKRAAVAALKSHGPKAENAAHIRFAKENNRG